MQHAVMGCHSKHCCVCPLGTLHHGKVRTELRLYGAGHCVKLLFFCFFSRSLVGNESKFLPIAFVVLSALSIPHGVGERTGADHGVREYVF